MVPAAESSIDRFVITRVFKAPRQRVWEAWTNPEHLGRWYGPKGSSARIAAHDVRPGGMLHLRLDSPGGGTLWAKFIYREVTAPSRLVWVQSFSDAQANLARAPFFDGKWPLDILTEVAFADEGAGTRVTLTCTPIDATGAEREVFVANKPSMDQGWTGSFEVLDAFLTDG